MKVGITLPNVGPQATNENIFQLATQAEKEGFDSPWTIRRVLWPLKPQSIYPATPDGTLPIEYQNVLDALDLLAYVAANTSNLYQEHMLKTCSFLHLLCLQRDLPRQTFCHMEG